MNAIRRDEALDNLSIYVDQWDWEKVITAEERNLETLKAIVQAIVTCVCHALDTVRAKCHHLSVQLKREVSIVTSQELEDLYPQSTPEQRAYYFVREHGTAFVM